MNAAARRLTKAEYLSEMASAYGPDPREWRVKCPVCGIVYRLADCGPDGERGCFCCIGRINGKGGQAFGGVPPNEHGCNFASNGLFRSPWVLTDVQVDNSGRGCGVMPIAPPVETGVTA